MDCTGDEEHLRQHHQSSTSRTWHGRRCSKSGVLIGLCDVVLTVYSAGAAPKMNMTPEAVKKEWIAGLMPGIQYCSIWCIPALRARRSWAARTVSLADLISKHRQEGY